MKPKWDHFAGWGLMMAALLFLAILGRLDLLLIVGPLSLLFGYRLNRVRSEIHSERR